MAGDRDAIAAVAVLVRRVVSDRGYWIPVDERADVIQDAIVRIYQAVSSPGFRLERDFDAYIRSVAHHRCIDWIRRHRPTVPVDPAAPNPGPGPERALVASERRRRGRTVLQALGPACLRVIRLRIRDRLSHREIAERLGRTEGGVRTQLYKCLERARRIARRLESDGSSDRPDDED